MQTGSSTLVRNLRQAWRGHCSRYRGGTWVLPRYIRGRPYDHHLTRLALALPVAVRRVAFRRQIERTYRDAGFTVKQLRAKGLPVPAFDLRRTRLTPVGDLVAANLHPDLPSPDWLQVSRCPPDSLCEQSSLLFAQSCATIRSAISPPIQLYVHVITFRR